MSEILKATGIKKGFLIGSEFLEVLKGVDFSLQKEKSVAIMGPSGSGKSTLLHILGGLDPPDAGKVFIEDYDITSARDGDLAQIRNKKIGFVFQFHHLLPDFTVTENVALPLLIRGQDYNSALRSARDLISSLGLKERLRHRPEQLSAGERQRAAVARAVITKPTIILADEPTGNLDYENSIMILDLLRCLNKERDIGLVIVSHNKLVRQYTDYQLSLEGGILSALR